MNNPKRFIKLDELAGGNLPNRIVESIEEMTLTTCEVVEWDQSKPSFHMSIKDGVFHVRINKQYSLKKLFAILGSVIGTIWAVIQFAIPYFA